MFLFYIGAALSFLGLAIGDMQREARQKFALFQLDRLAGGKVPTAFEERVREIAREEHAKPPPIPAAK